MKVDHFIVEDSKVNKQQKILVAVLQNGDKYVCSGDHWAPTYLQPYDTSWDTADHKEAIKP